MLLPPSHPAPVLAQSGVGAIFGWSLVLIVLIFVAFFAVVRLRNWLREDQTPASIGFSLTDLRQLHREGKMTDAEFEKARNLMVAHAKRTAERLPDPLAGSKAARDRRGAAGAPADPPGQWQASPGEPGTDRTVK